MTTSRVSVRQDAWRVLRLTWPVVEPRLRTSGREFCGPFHTVAGYHLGWHDEHGEPVAARGGKAVRPALTLLAAEEAGGPVDAAVAVELVHNFSLVHDDVMDEDVRRRHRGTVWSVFGVPVAILTGDAKLVAAQQVLIASGHHSAVRALTELTGATQRMLHGQLMDVASSRAGTWTSVSAWR